MTGLQVGTALGGLMGLAIVFVLVLFRERLGVLNAASWLVILGASVLVAEHAQFAISFAVNLTLDEGLLIIPSHPRFHFFMSGIYTIVGVTLLCVVARTLLREGRRAGWYSILFALLFGGTFELLIGGLWFQHGSPLYSLFGENPSGWGWEFLCIYLVAWAAALVISYKPVFEKGSARVPA